MSAMRRHEPKAAPLAMTDAEVAAKARGEDKEVARRLAQHSPTKGVGRLASDKPAPPRISAAEMEQIQRARGRLPDQVRERLTEAREPHVSPEPKRARKLLPEREPGDQS